MKKPIKYFLITAAIIFGITSYAFKNMIPFASSVNQSINEGILGIWILENDPSTKIRFLPNGRLETYEDNVLQGTDSYSILNSCGEETLNSGELFLKTIDGDNGTEYCEIINGVNANGSNILSLTSDSGKLSIYVRH